RPINSNSPPGFHLTRSPVRYILAPALPLNASGTNFSAVHPPCFTYPPPTPPPPLYTSPPTPTSPRLSKPTHHKQTPIITAPPTRPFTALSLSSFTSCQPLNVVHSLGPYTCNNSPGPSPCLTSLLVRSTSTSSPPNNILPTLLNASGAKSTIWLNNAVVTN